MISFSTEGRTTYVISDKRFYCTVDMVYNLDIDKVASDVIGGSLQRASGG